MLSFVRIVLFITLFMFLFGAFGLVVFEVHWLPQWFGGMVGAVVGIGLALAAEGLLDASCQTRK